MGLFADLFGSRKKMATVPAAPKPKVPPKIGLALGGGGFKGAAHIGVLKVLAELGIKIDYIAGTSVGSAVAALHASGCPLSDMEALLMDDGLAKMFKLRPGRRGLIPGTAYTERVREMTRGRRIEEMDIPLRIIAVDLLSWNKVVFSEGDAALAVRASSAVPAVFTPVELNGMLLADGYLLDNCPGGVVRDMGADIVIAVSLSTPSYGDPGGLLGIVNRSLNIATSGHQVIDADIILRPIKEASDMLDDSHMQEHFRLGEEVTRAHIDEIKALIEARTK